MNVGILGSGMVGQAIGAKLAERGVNVVLGTRTPQHIAEQRGMGAPLAEWLSNVGTNGRLPIWIRLWGVLGTPMFNFKIAR